MRPAARLRTGQVVQAYRREYKRRFARSRDGKMEQSAAPHKADGKKDRLLLLTDPDGVGEQIRASFGGVRMNGINAAVIGEGPLPRRPQRHRPGADGPGPLTADVPLALY